jgi:mandelate racemase
MSGATVRRVVARGLLLEPDRPTETAAGVMATTPLVLVDLETTEGVVGHSYVRSYAPAALAALTRLVADLGELAEGEPAAPATIEAGLRARLRLLGTSGLVGMALAGIDMAAWDALARRLGVPLATLLGGEPRPVRAYASLRTMEPAAAAAEAEEALGAGFTAVKLKVGRAGLDEDLAAIRAVRGAVGEGTRIMVDYNQSLSVPEAIERARVLDGEGLEWIEEPTRAHDPAGNARVAAAARTAIQLGENWSGTREMAASLAAGASDHATLDVMRLGGVTGWLRAAALAEAAAIPASSHAFIEFSAQLLPVTSTALWLEYLDHAGQILVEPLRIAAGQAQPSTAPGAGLEWDEARIRRVGTTTG